MQPASRKYQGSYSNDRPSSPSGGRPDRSRGQRRNQQPQGNPGAAPSGRPPSDGGFRNRSQGYYANSNSAFFQKFQENYKKQLSGERGTQLYQSAFPIKHIPEKLNFSYRLLGRNIFNKASSSGPGNLSDCSIGGRADRGITRRRRRIQKRFKNYMRFQAQQGNLRESAAVINSLRTSPKRTSVRSNSARSPSYPDSFRRADPKLASGGTEQSYKDGSALKKRKRTSASDASKRLGTHEKVGKRRRSGADSPPRRSKRSGSQETGDASGGISQRRRSRKATKGHHRASKRRASKCSSGTINRDRSISDVTMRSCSASFSSSADLSGSLSRSVSNSSFEQSSQSSVYNSSRHSDCSSRSYLSSYSTCSSAQLPAPKGKSSAAADGHRDRKFRNRNYRGRNNTAVSANQNDADGNSFSDASGSSINHGPGGRIDDSIRNDAEESKRHRRHSGKKRLGSAKKGGVKLSGKSKHKGVRRSANNREESPGSHSSCSCSPVRKRTAVSGGNGCSPSSLQSSPNRAAGKASKVAKKRRKQTAHLSSQSVDKAGRGTGSKRKSKAAPSSLKSGGQAETGGTSSLRRTHPTKKKKDPSEDSESSLLDLRDNLFPIGHFIRDRETMLEEMLKSIKGKKLNAMLPDILKSRDFEEVKARCLDQLECMSKKRIACILAGKEMTSSSGTEDSSDEVEAGTASGPAVNQPDHRHAPRLAKKHPLGEPSGEFLPDKMRPLESLPDSGPEDFTERIAAEHAISKQNASKADSVASNRTSTDASTSLLSRQRRPITAATMTTKARRDNTESSHSSALAANARCVRADEDFDDYYEGFKSVRRVPIRAVNDSPTTWTAADGQSLSNTPLSPDPSDRYCGLHDTEYANTVASASPSVHRRVICSECENSYSSSDALSPSSYDTECSACEQREQTGRRGRAAPNLSRYKADDVPECKESSSDSDGEMAKSHIERWVDMLVMTDEEDESVLVNAEIKYRLGAERPCSLRHEASGVETINEGLLLFSINSLKRDCADSDADDEATEGGEAAVADALWSEIEQENLEKIVDLGLDDVHTAADRSNKENLMRPGMKGADERPFTETRWPKSIPLQPNVQHNGKNLRTRLELWLLERQARVLRDALGSKKVTASPSVLPEQQAPSAAFNEDDETLLKRADGDLCSSDVVADVVFAIRDFAVTNFTVQV